MRDIMSHDMLKRDISKVDFVNTFFHYTNRDNLFNISKEGLDARIGENSLYVEKNKKVFFAKGKDGVLTIMDVWLKWLTAKSCINPFIYYFGTTYMRIPFCIKGIPNYIVSKTLKNRKNRMKAYEEMKDILDSSVFLVLDLEENVDFDYSDIDEVKETYYESFLKLLYPSESNLKDKRMEYWNMHTYFNKGVDTSKISLLTYKEKDTANFILKILMEDNLKSIENKYQFLYEYYQFCYGKEIDEKKKQNIGQPIIIK